MNQALVDRVVNAVLYEGYILYPYRPAIKNRQRWTFGGLYPEAYCPCANDRSSMQTECLVAGAAETVVSVCVRFLHIVARQVAALDKPLQTWPVSDLPPYRLVDAMQVGRRTIPSWQEAIERQITLEETKLSDLLGGERSFAFTYPAGRELEPLRDDSGVIVGLIIRERQALTGSVDWNATAVDDGLFKLRVRIANRTPWDMADTPRREEAVLRALASTHTILGVRGGEFVSLLDTPERWRPHAESCHNIGTYPVLIGDEGATDTILSSPIILYDYPQIAPESPGDLFDGGEIDEILSLRILTLTDEEKQQVAELEPRARAMLERTEALDPEQLLALHGTIRSMRPVTAEADHV